MNIYYNILCTWNFIRGSKISVFCYNICKSLHLSKSSKNKLLIKKYFFTSKIMMFLFMMIYYLHILTHIHPVRVTHFPLCLFLTNHFLKKYFLIYLYKKNFSPHISKQLIYYNLINNILKFIQ